MLQHIYQYYTDEKSGFAYALSAGIIFLLIGLLFWMKFSANPISKGLGTGLAIAGAILIIGSFSTQYYNNKQIQSLSQRRTETELQLQQSEMQRMDKVMNVTFRYAFITFGVLITSLILIVIISKSCYWKGFCFAFIFLVLFVLIADTYNSKRNAEYFKIVKELKL